MWQMLMILGILLLGLGFTGSLKFIGVDLIEGMEYAAIGIGVLMILGAGFMRYRQPPDD